MIEERQFDVEGMTCSACVHHVEKTLSDISGVHKVQVNLTTNSAFISLEESLNNSSLLEAVDRAGYKLLPKKTRITQSAKLSIELSVAIVCTIPLFILSMFLPSFKGSYWLQLLLTIPVVAFSGRNIFRKAIKQIGQRAAGMDTLIAVGTGSAFFISIIVTLFPRLVENTLLNGLVYFETAAVVITLVLTGNYLEERAEKSSTRAMNSLLLDQPKEVEIIRDGFTTSMSSMDITSGDLVIIKAGQSFPIDGIIFE